ncbi:hypothetical protein GCM10009067_24330 [Haloarcula sebkhae]|uniref:DUF7344 domain-containing protein n=2 Tax=Haloarcula sebkhae TaxID=932660 RepID=A0A830ES65_9EURY|nr:hypothetical protein GCM10009067_24330 [Haloarcula sebkhae]
MSEPMVEEEPELSRDQMFDILSSSRRRYTLYYLRQQKEPVQLTDLAEELAAWENDTTVEELSSQARKRVYVSLYQTHAPKLQEAGLITYDADTGEIALREDAPEVEPFISNSDGDSKWYQYYGAVALLNAILLLAAIAGLPPLNAISPLVIGLVVISSFLVLSIAHAVTGRRGKNDNTFDIGEP